MADATTIVAGPPKAELVRVMAFLPGVILEDDTRFQSLASAMDTQDVEFSKALVVKGGNASAAAALIFPDMSEQAQRQWGSRHKKHPQVMALFEYLNSLNYTDDRPVTFDEYRREINKRWRSCPKDNGAFMDLSKTMLQINGLKVESVTNENEMLAVSLQRADEIIASMRAGAVH